MDKKTLFPSLTWLECEIGVIYSNIEKLRCVMSKILSRLLAVKPFVEALTMRFLDMVEVYAGRAYDIMFFVIYRDIT
nr:hypothetical protein [Rhodospirillales bacterium]